MRILPLQKTSLHASRVECTVCIGPAHVNSSSDLRSSHHSIQHTVTSYTSPQHGSYPSLDCSHLTLLCCTARTEKKAALLRLAVTTQHQRTTTCVIVSTRNENARKSTISITALLPMNVTLVHRYECDSNSRVPFAVTLPSL